MGAYDKLAAELASLMSEFSGGPKDERLASAGLLYASLHYECVQVVRSLRREGIEATVYEDVSSFSMRINGTRITVQRFSSQSEVAFDFYGFDTRLIPAVLGTVRHEVPALSRQEIEQTSAKVGRAICGLWEAEVRYRSEGSPRGWGHGS